MAQETGERHGTVSSSSIWKLMTKGKGVGMGAPGKKYIRQVKHEINLGRPINKESSARSTSWGKFAELYVFGEKLNSDYVLVSKKRLFHKEIPEWSGATDLLKDSVTADVKCPYSLEVFCDKLEALQDIKVYKEEYPEDYWQHLSNAILLEQNGIEVTHFEAIIFCPFQSELNKMREATSVIEDPTIQKQMRWLEFTDDEEIPYLVDGGKYLDINIIKHKIPEEDKWLLTDTVRRVVEENLRNQ